MRLLQCEPSSGIAYAHGGNVRRLVSDGGQMVCHSKIRCLGVLFRVPSRGSMAGESVTW